MNERVKVVAVRAAVRVAVRAAVRAADRSWRPAGGVSPYFGRRPSQGHLRHVYRSVAAACSRGLRHCSSSRERERERERERPRSDASGVMVASLSEAQESFHFSNY